MLALLLQNFRHILRTRLLVFLLLFSFLIQFIGVRLLHSVTLQFQGIISKIDSNDALFLALIFQIFTGAFLSAVYGIWMVPYAHQGLRSHLTFTLPVSKWMFPLCYALSMLGLLVLQHLIMALCFGFNFGFESFLSPKFPWSGLALCILLETLAFEMCMFAFAFSAMSLGQVPTFFLGASILFSLQVAGAVFRFNLERFATQHSGAFGIARKVYESLPPVGELVYDLRESYVRPLWSHPHLVLWAMWLGIFMLLFRYQLRYPSKSKSAET